MSSRRARSGGELDRHDGEPVVEVLAEAALVDRAREVAVGRGDDADVDRALAVLADAPDLARLEHAEELRLHRRAASSPISSRKSVPAVRLLEGARPVGDRAGEGAPHVAEELALDQVFGDGAAVDGDERPARRVECVVDGPGDQLLARPRLALDEHGGRSARPARVSE